MYVPLIDRENQMDARQQAVKQAIEEQRPIIVTADDDDDEAIGELQVAEYVIFLLALDTYIRYVEEATGVEDPEDDVIRRGVRLLRMADSELGAIRSFLDDSLPNDTHKRMLVKYLRLRVSDSAGVGRRAFGLTRLLNRGGPTTMRAVFKTNRALRQIKVAMASAAMDDGDAALDKFAGLPMQNARIRGWVDLAAKTAGSGELPENPIQAGVKEAADMAPAMLSSQVEEMATTEAEIVQEAQEDQTDKITEVELAATEAARKTMDLSGETDELMTKSEVIGVATAVAAAVTSDPSNPANIPQSLKDTRLDDEQLAAAMTDGRVLVAAGAGAGKSTTLVARIKHLVQDRGVSPSRIMATSFSSDSASELKERVGKSIGKSLTNQMNAGNDRWTLHSTFKKVILAHGTPDEKDAMKGDPKRVSGAVARKVQELWAVCFDGEDRPLPSKGEMEKFKTQWAGNNISPAQAKTDARSIKETDAAQWYEMYEGLKGAIPGWTPPCASQAANAVLGQFMSKVRRGKRLGDFDDMLGIAHRILKDNPGVRKTLQRQFDHVLIDECQDLNLVQNELFEMITEHIDVEKGQSIWMVGDDRQCVAADTFVTMCGPAADPPEGGQHGKLARDLNPGDPVLAYRNGEVVPQKIRYVKPSHWTWGYKITTESGRTLTMTPNHKIWALSPELDDNQHLVYLMFKEHMGFRVGVTNRGRSETNPYGSRMLHERADRLWVLDVVNDREDALLKEESYSLEYGIPTLVFEGTGRGINQERVDAIFERFGRNGMRLLEAKHLVFDYPNWMAAGTTRGRTARRLVNLAGHGAKGSQVRLEWSGSIGSAADDVLAEYNVRVSTRGEHQRLRKFFTNYRDALQFALQLREASGTRLRERLCTPEGLAPLLTASALIPGMKVVVQDADFIDLENITSIERVEGEFVDLDVDDASNFFGGGILSHNSIYGFRGARPDVFIERAEKEEWKLRPMRTNYRCEPEHVEASNRLIAHNKKQIGIEANPSPHKTRGTGSLKVLEMPDEATSALSVIEGIKHAAMSESSSDQEKLKFYGTNAVLTRTNKELHAFETACIIRGIPYGRKGSSSFFGSHETMTMLGYVQLLTGDNMAKMQASLGIIINKPNRVYVSERHGKDAVKEAIREYAKATDTFIKDLNPMVALRDSRFQDVLARKLTRSRPGDFKFDKAVESLETLTDELDQIQMDMDDPEFKTKDLFNGILGLSGKDTKTDPKTGRRLPVATSLGNVLAGQLRDAKGKEDDEEEEDDDAPLGNVAFLYELAEVDPTDEADLENDPGTPLGFKAKMERYAERMRELRIDLSKYTGPIDELPGVYLGTSHSVKGLEWNNTFVSMPEGKFPLKLRVDPEDPPTPEEMEAHMEDERRLAYVALTRSMKNMTILCPNFVEGKEAGVSMFVDEAGLGMGENIAQVGTDAAIVEEAEGIMKKEAADDYEGPPSLRPEDIAYLKGRWNPKGGE